MQSIPESRARTSAAAEDLPEPARRRRPATSSLLAALAFATLVLAACGGGQEPPAEEPAPTGQAANGGAQPCTAPAAWFPHAQTPEPDPNQPFASFCDFHQWAWQSFLWLTQEVDGRLRFETFPTVADVIAGEVASNGGPLRLEVRTQKADGPHQALDEVTQADSLGVLVDHGGRAVYYSQHVNPLMFQEIVSLRWNDPAVLQEIPPDTEFQTGDVELKASWKIVEAGEDVSTLYVTSARVDRLAQGPGGTIVIDGQSPPLEVEVALVGLHVVGWVNGHPEAVWATFEHDDNAPDFAPDQDPSAPVSDRGWTFYTAGTAALDCNVVDTGNLVLDPQAQTLTPISQACRQFPYGMVAGTEDPNDLQNLAAIQELNASVKAQIGGDVFGNYFEVGAIWTNGDLQPNDDQQAHRIGSTLLNSSVIETFTQNVSSENNCFSCHNTLQYNPADPSIPPLQGTNLNLSHIILEAYVANQPKGETR